MVLHASHLKGTTHRAPAFGDDQRHAFQGHKLDGRDGADPLQAGSMGRNEAPESLGSQYPL